MQIHQTLIKQIQTEKGVRLAELSRYMFQVDNQATKQDVKRAVEYFYKVQVVSVNTMLVKGKVKNYGGRPSKRPNWKKAIVVLNKDDSIDYTAFKNK